MPAPTPDFTLAIEISNPPLSSGAGEVALSTTTPDGQLSIIASRIVAPSSRHDDALMPAIDGLCRQASITPAALTRIAVSAGPGGYTSVRIAVTTAKMIAIATGARLHIVPTATVAWLSLDQSIRAAHPTRIILAWKRTDAYCADFEPNTPPTHPSTGHIRALIDIAADTSRHIATDDKLIQTLRAMNARAPLHHATLTAANVARAAIALPPSDPLTATPIYPREPEAVTKWRQLGKSKQQD